ncbi:MAG TPA: sigma 54-interacting transcriptional regulator [Polyangiaceae bacterium]|nr:sigma 54-interacting transcriptional regulator [Polyangiaceae bacterium]
MTVRGQSCELTGLVGEGATSQVWAARSGERELVVKVAKDRAQRARLAEEALHLLFVDAANVPALLGAGLLEDGMAYLVLESAPGRALEGRPRPAAAALELALVVARDVSGALADLHALGLAHGDLKPDNIVIEERDGRPVAARLVDLGLSGPSEESVPRGGTRGYLAPEVFVAGATSDARQRDLWALGRVLSELFEGPAPAPFSTLLPALMAAAPAARPSASWLRRQALVALGETTFSDSPERRSRRVKHGYLALRRAELMAAARAPRCEIRVPGLPGAWLQAALEVAREVALLRADPARAEADTVLAELSALGRARWLVTLVGPAAAHWPVLELGDEALSGRLLDVAARGELERLTWSELQARPRVPARWETSGEALELGLALENGDPDPALLDAAEERLRPGGDLGLGLALARALRRRGQLGRALHLLQRWSSPEAGAEAAELARRAGDAVRARELLATLDLERCSASTRARARASAARLELGAGATHTALELLQNEPDSAAVLETRALVELALGQRQSAAASLERARLLATSDEERARIEAAVGNVTLAGGDADSALSAFRRAAELAARSGAVLEEATYLTGVAASASQLGELGEGLSAARRSLLLFEALGRTGEAARAALSIAATLRAAGAGTEAREAALDAVARAKLSGDRRCRAYAHWVLADLCQAPDHEGLEHARFAAANVDDRGDDALRAAARLHEHGEEVEVARFDALAQEPSTAQDARFEWWGARARRERPLHADRVVRELLQLCAAPAPVVVRGPALCSGAELARRTGDGDAARRLNLAATDAARELVRRVPAELKAAVSSLPWVRAADAAAATDSLSPEQLRDVEALVRALGRRDGLRALLRQVLDALVLWTGVERGLLLLRAPGGKLRPRAARNLSKGDLTGEQLSLSHSLAERALALGEPFVAVDAAGDLPEIHHSVHALKLRSVLAVPLIAHGEALGVVYLDDRMRRGAFGPRELAWVRLVATLASVAIADARAALLLRRSARRAQRAEAKLEKELARREAALDVAERELGRMREGRETRFAYDAIVGQSEAMRAMLRVVDRVTLSEVPVLLVGESGSGKELVARAIHDNGPRAGRPFVSENCGAIPETLLESTLFGHVRGAFTGASRPRAGLFEVASGGTLFLDEIAEMSLGMQSKLLRALQNGEIRPVGAESPRRVDVRVLGATHRDLDAMVAAGTFREDLYYRLNVITVRLPALRERSGDVPLLVRSLVERHGGKRRVRVSKSALDILGAFAWPGNVRQLENEVRRALVLCDDTILPDHLSPEVRHGGGAETGRSDGLNLRERLDALEAELVRTALGRTQGNQTRAAELLGVSRFGLQKMMKRLEIASPA